MRSGWKAKLQRGRQEQAEHSRLGKTENSCFVLSAEKKSLILETKLRQVEKAISMSLLYESGKCLF